MTKSALFPDGHFYSPVVNTEEVIADEERIWSGAKTLPGVDFNPASHQRLLKRWFPRFVADYDYPEEGPEDAALQHFYERNTQFASLDSRTLFCMLRLIQPGKIIEVGSGYSTMLMADVNSRFLADKVRITCIEPYPRPFLHTADAEGRITLIPKRAQDVDLDMFRSLGEGDILFIDSSHVSKTGSDVNRLLLEVLPILAPGVYIHVHDIFLPADYPKDWVIEQNRCWNEQYVLQAFLAFNSAFRIVFGCAVAVSNHEEAVRNLFDGKLLVGGSLWLRREPKSGLLHNAFRLGKRHAARLARRGYYHP